MLSFSVKHSLCDNREVPENINEPLEKAINDCILGTASANQAAERAETVADSFQQALLTATEKAAESKSQADHAAASAVSAAQSGITAAQSAVTAAQRSTDAHGYSLLAMQYRDECEEVKDLLESGELATLTDGKLTASQIPGEVYSTTFAVFSEQELSTLNAKKGMLRSL